MEVVVAPAARDDIRQAYTYHAERNPAVAARLVRSIVNAIDGLRRYPLIGRSGAVPGTRERMLTRYPYKIVYEVHGERIEVARILHMAQRWPEEPQE